MTIYVEPKAGMVINYGYVWARQARQGMEEGQKFRPSLILGVQEEQDKKMVYVAPITHTPPFYPEESVLVPNETGSRIGLDDKPKWLMLNEVNKFEWPGLDIRRVPHRRERSQFYGFVPRQFLEQARDKMREMMQQNRFNVVPRRMERKGVMAAANDAFARDRNQPQARQQINDRQPQRQTLKIPNYGGSNRG